MNIFKTIKSWFVKPAKISSSEEIQRISDAKQEKITDAMGNELHELDNIILLAYNDKRRNYMTIPTKFCIIPYTKDITSDFISVNSYLSANCWESRRKGFLHIAR